MEHIDKVVANMLRSVEDVSNDLLDKVMEVKLGHAAMFLVLLKEMPTFEAEMSTALGAIKADIKTSST